MNDLLILLGKRVHELRAAKNWSQEEFAHVSGFHRTYVGQIERGEKNMSFSNLSKLSGVLGVTLAELLAGLESGASREDQSIRPPNSGSRKTDDAAHQMFEIQKVAKRLKLQHAAMDRTVATLEKLAASEGQTPPRRKGATSRLPKKA